MAINPLNTAISGLRTNQFRLNTAANNVANINTDEFRSRVVQSADLGYINNIGQGVRVASANYAAPHPTPAAPGDAGETPAAPSDTDPAREMTGLASTRAAYSANVVMGRTADEMLQTIIDLKA